MPYSFSAFGVLPPLWSSAAMNPEPFLAFSNCSVFMSALSSSSGNLALPGSPHAGWLTQIRIFSRFRCHTQIGGRVNYDGNSDQGGYRTTQERRSAAGRTARRHRPRSARVLGMGRRPARRGVRDAATRVADRVLRGSGDRRLRCGLQAIGRSRRSTTSTTPAVTQRSSVQSRQARRSTTCPPRSRSSWAR